MCQTEIFPANLPLFLQDSRSHFKHLRSSRDLSHRRQGKMDQIPQARKNAIIAALDAGKTPHLAKSHRYLLQLAGRQYHHPGGRVGAYR